MLFAFLTLALTPVPAAPVASPEPPAVVAVHLHLSKSAPAKDETLASSPATIRLWFSQKPETALTAVNIERPDRMILSRLKVVDGSEEHEVRADVTTPLAPGSYVIAWRTSSPDGHVVRGRIPFTIDASAKATSSAK